MSAQAAGIGDKNNSDAFDFAVLVTILVAALVGAGIGAGISFLYSIAAGSMPKLWGFQRILLDSIAGALWAVVVLCYIGKVLMDHDKLSAGGIFEVSFGDFINEHPWTSLVGFLLAVDFIASIFLSLTVGLITALVLSLLALLIYSACEFISLITRFSAAFFFGPEDDD